MGQKGYCVVSGVFFALVALAHLLRIAYGLSIQVEDVAVPMWASWFAVIVPAGLTIWALRLAGRSNVS